MDSGLISIIVALIGGLALILSNLTSLRKENRVDHDVVLTRLDTVSKSLDKVADKIDEHIVDHAKGMM
jgi:hypothetical protein